MVNRVSEGHHKNRDWAAQTASRDAICAEYLPTNAACVEIAQLSSALSQRVLALLEVSAPIIPAGS